MFNVRPLLTAAATLLLTGTALADYRMTLQETGMLDYYCSITVSLENLSDEPLAEINGHFFSYVGEEEVGRSRGALFLDMLPGAAARHLRNSERAVRRRDQLPLRRRQLPPRRIVRRPPGMRAADRAAGADQRGGAALAGKTSGHQDSAAR